MELATGRYNPLFDMFVQVSKLELDRPKDRLVSQCFPDGTARVPVDPFQKMRKASF